MQSFRGCVIGHPLGHTRSPRIHNRWLRQYGIAGGYEARPLPPERFDDDIADILAGHDGVNVTLPYKEAVMPLCATLDDTAAAIGAVNTIGRDAAGGLRGYNTDSYGFIENVRAGAPGFHFDRRPAVILGAGGAARAAVYGLLRAGSPRIVVVNRNRARADALAAAFGVEAADWDDAPRHLRDAGLLVNATSLGMHGQPPLAIDLDGLPADTAVCDMVYAPLMTPLLDAAVRRGNPVVTGIGMLLHQAALAFRIWTGILPTVDAACVAAALEDAA